MGSPLDDDLSEEEDEEGDHGLGSQSPDDDGVGLPLLVPASAVTVSPAAAGPFAHVAQVIPDPPFALADPIPRPADDKPYACPLADCPCAPHIRFERPGELADHFRLHHKPLSRIPTCALQGGIVQCGTCYSLFCGAGYLQRHVSKEHAPTPSTDAPAAAAAADPASPSTPAAADTADAPAAAAAPAARASVDDYYTTNREFFGSIGLDDIRLHHVHSLAVPLPPSLRHLLDATLTSFARHILLDLDGDAPVFALYAHPRLLLFPPASDLRRAQLLATLAARFETLRTGGASRLWTAFDWLAAQPNPVDLAPSGGLIPDAVLRRTAARSPMAAFNSMTSLPFMPPTQRTLGLLLDLVPTAHNPDLDPDSLPTLAASLLPTQPFGRGFAALPDKAAVVESWTKHFATTALGAPDGTGLQCKYWPQLPTAWPLLAQCLDAWQRLKITPAHRRLLASGTMGGQAKPDKVTGKVPSSAEDVMKVRPLKRSPHIRRLLEGKTNGPLTKHARPSLESLRQYGLIPDGLTAAPHRHQMLIDHDPTIPPATIDICNAHTSIARMAVYRLLADRYNDTRHYLDHHAVGMFLCFYSLPTVAIFQVGRTFESRLQTDGLDQGNALSQYFFGYCYAAFLDSTLRGIGLPCFHTCVHDDTVIAARFHLSDALNDSDLPTEPQRSTPLPFILASLESYFADYLRLRLALQKTVVLMPRPPSAPTAPPTSRLRPCDYPHLFPQGTTFTDSHFNFGGQHLVAATNLLPSILATDIDRYRQVLVRATNLPIKMQPRLLLLAISCRPTCRFGHFLRYLPPSIISAFVDDLRREILHAFERTLALPAGTVASSPPEMASHFQFFQALSAGGIGFDDPARVSPAAYLASMASTLPIHRRDPAVATFVKDPSNWATCPSLILRDAYNVFHRVTSTAAYSALPLADCPIAARPTLRATLNDASGSPSLHRLHLLSGMRSQSRFSRLLATEELNTALAHPSLHPLAFARLRHAAVPPSHLLFTMCSVSDAHALSDDETTYLYLYRLGVPFPSLATSAALPFASCHERCCAHPPHRPFPNAKLLCLHSLGHHYTMCGVRGHSIRLHDLIVRLIAATAMRETGCAAHLEKGLGSSTAAGKKIDAVLSFANRTVYAGSTPTAVMTIDVSRLCPLLPSHLQTAARDAAATIDERAREKNAKHLAGCIGLGRAFLPIVVTTLGGIGPPASRDFLSSLFANSMAAERASGGSGQLTAKRRSDFFRSIMVLLVRKQHLATTDLAKPLARPAQPPPPKPRSEKKRRASANAANPTAAFS